MLNNANYSFIKQKMTNTDTTKTIPKVVILAGNGDFGHCPLASHLPAPLWPIGTMPALLRLLRNLARRRFTRAVICSSDERNLAKSIGSVNFMHLDFLAETMPLGTAGCLRNAVRQSNENRFLIIGAQRLTLPNFDDLLAVHKNSNAHLTIVSQKPPTSTPSATYPAEIYICQPSVLRYIPSKGYFDIKEGLVPAMLRAGMDIHAHKLNNSAAAFRDMQSYLDTISEYLTENTEVNADLADHKNAFNFKNNIWVAKSAKIDPDARIYGPAMIMDQAVIEKNAIIFGPTQIGRKVLIGKGALVQNSVLWDNAAIGKNSQLRNSVVASNAAVPNNAIIQNCPVIQKQTNSKRHNWSSTYQSHPHLPDKPRNSRKVNPYTFNWPKTIQKLKWPMIITVLLAAFLWSYKPQIVGLWSIWKSSDEYSSGLLVPFLAVYILWTKRKQLAETPIKPSLWGLAAFVFAQAFRHFGLFFMYSSAQRLSLIATLASLLLFLFGWRLLRKLIPILLFICLMIPPPRSIHAAFMLPLQSVATTSAVFFLEIMGYSLVRHGNIIDLNGTTVAIAEACNGLRMVTAFFIITGLVVMIIERPWWEKLIVLLSSLPIALVCNAVRLTATAIVFTMISGENYESTVHDFAGYAMMPLALAAVICELWILTKLTANNNQTIPVIVTQQNQKLKNKN